MPMLLPFLTSSYCWGSGLLRGFGEAFPVPVSRQTEVPPPICGRGGRGARPSAKSGLCLLEDRDRRAVYMSIDWKTTPKPCAMNSCATGGPEDVEIPRDYFPSDDPDGRR